MSLIKKSGVTSILSVHDLRYRDLNYCEVKFVSNSFYQIAKSFYTASWISPGLLGASSVCPAISDLRLDDVATVLRYTDAVEWRNTRPISEHDLKSIYDKVFEGARIFLSEHLRQTSEDIIIEDVDFTFLPSPAIIALLSRGDDVLGSIVIYSNKDAKVVFGEDQLLDKIVCTIRANMNQNVFGGFLNYGQS